MEQKTDWKAIRSLVYSKVYIPSVFSEVLGITFDPRRRFINPLRPSKTADSGFFRDKTNTDIWYFKDFASGEVYDIFSAIQRMFNINFPDAVAWLGNTYCFSDELTELGFNSPSGGHHGSIRSSNSMAYMNMLRAIKKKIEYPIEPEVFKYGWDEENKPENSNGWIFHCQGYQIITTRNEGGAHDLFWQKRGMDMPSNCYEVESFISQSGKVIFKHSEEDPIFFFIGTNESGQIYKPYGTKATKFRNLGSGGFISVGGHKDYAIISKGFKDFNELAQMGFTVAGKCGESSRFDPNEYMFFKYKYLFLLLDNDAAGIKAAQKQIEYYASLNIKAFSITVPESLGKDIDDVVVKYGLKAAKKLVLHLIKETLRNKINGKNSLS